MMPTTIHAVFHGDGYECENLIGVFDSAEAAEEVRVRIEGLIKRYYAEHQPRHQWRGSVSVRPLELGKYELPGDAADVVERDTIARGLGDAGH